MNCSRLRFFSITGVLVTASFSTARSIEAWDYDRLFNAADVVAIVCPAKVQSHADTTMTKTFGGREIMCDAVTFEARFKLKGDAQDYFSVNFYRRANIKKVDVAPPNVPDFSAVVRQFETELKSQTNNSPSRSVRRSEFLVFLKRDSAGTLHPVSGDFDSLFSVRSIIPTVRADE